MWWKSKESFEADAIRADETKLRQMRQWAIDHEEDSDRAGMGRNKKARSHFRGMHLAADQELERRGLSF